MVGKYRTYRHLQHRIDYHRRFPTSKGRITVEEGRDRYINKKKKKEPKSAPKTKNTQLIPMLTVSSPHNTSPPKKICNSPTFHIVNQPRCDPKTQRSLA